jgi:hypothetical protein
MKLYILIILLTFSFKEPIHAVETKVKDISPSITFMFDAALYGTLSDLSKITTEEEFKTNLNTAVARQAYMLCYAYWYMVNVEKMSVLDKRKETTVTSLLKHLKKFNFDIRGDLNLIRKGKNKPLSELELRTLHGLISFPCNVSDFVSDEKYAKRADDFVYWTKKLTGEK